MDAKRPEDSYEDEKSARSDDGRKHGPIFDKNTVDTAAVLAAGADVVVDPAAAAKLRYVDIEEVGGYEETLIEYTEGK